VKITKTRLTLLALANLTLPIASQAATESDAMKACAAAFVQKLEESRQTKLRMKVGEDFAKSDLVLIQRSTMFRMTAYEADGKNTYAKAECYVTPNARVTAIRNVF